MYYIMYYMYDINDDVSLEFRIKSFKYNHHKKIY